MRSTVIRLRSASAPAFLLLLVAAAAAQSTTAPTATSQPVSSAQDEVLANIKAQKIGGATVADLNYPDVFLRRVADRIIRKTFEQQFRTVLRPRDAATQPTSAPASRPFDASIHAGAASPIEFARAELDADVLAYRRGLSEARPALPGFRAAFLQDRVERASPPAAAAHVRPMQPTANDESLRAAAERVSRRLARDGVMLTLAQAVEILGTERVLADGAAGLRRLGDAGLPIDLLRYFRVPATDEGGAGEAVDSRVGPASVDERVGQASLPASAGGDWNDGWPIARHVALLLRDGKHASELREELARARFRFQPTRPGFRVATESGEYDAGLVRMQATRGDYWLGEGDGGGLDVLRQTLAALPSVPFVVSVESPFAEPLIEQLQRWAGGGSRLTSERRVTLAVEPLTVAQWAQDNGKPGVIVDETGNPRQIATLAPRYASRGEDGSTFVPGESFLMDGVAAAGQLVIQSPLLFQGGNLMAVLDGATGQRILLVGEAEILRNMALGLTRPQVLEAFLVEFGVNRCVVLAAVSYHIDYELTVRTRDGATTVFVNDTAAAVRIILRCGIEALEKSGRLEHATADSARAALADGHAEELLAIVGPTFFGGDAAGGRFSEPLASAFSRGATDLGAANLQRCLWAIDRLAADVFADRPEVVDPATREYFAALLRDTLERRQLHAQLEQLGWRLVAIPSTSAGDLSLNYVNGVQLRTRYLMPRHGGVFAPLDDAAAAAFRAAFGPQIEVVSIGCAESQRRNGAVHCSMAVYPVIPPR